MLNNDEINAELTKQIRQMCLMDDIFMSVFFDGQNHLMELVLKIILNTQDLKVLQTKTQFEIRSIGGRSARLDVLAIDSHGKRYNFEIQNADSGAIPQRARFHSAMLDSTLLKKNDKYADLPETYVIFLTENDVLKGNLPIYNIERIITQNGKIFGDGEHIIYVNGSYKAADALGKLIADFHCRDPKKMNFGELAERSNYVKYEQGEFNMNDAFKEFMQKLLNEKEEQTKIKTRTEDQKTFAKNMLKITDLPEGIIAASVDLTLDEVKELAKEVRKTKVAN